MPRRPTIRTGYRLDPSLIDALRFVSELSGLPQTRIIEDALRAAIPQLLTSLHASGKLPLELPETVQVLLTPQTHN